MEELLKRVYSSKKTSTLLKIISHTSVAVYVSAFILMLAHYCFSEPLSALKLAIAGIVPYILVSIVRRIINAPRPYQLYDFYKVLPKEKRGQSFPSRHVFSAFIIAVLAYPVSVWLFSVLMFLGILLAAARVLLGIHFIRDVVAGALIGIISAILGIFILF